METVVLTNNQNNSNNGSSNNNFTGSLLIGEKIGSYTILSKVETNSGEAEIYLCEKDNQKYILKYYFYCKPKLEVIEKIKSFQNPDIISLYEYGEYKNRFYEILEYAEGGSLDSKDNNGSYKYLPVTEEKAIQIVKEIINAFNECHKAGIIHRDIKPGNLFYKNKDGSDILVGDFGISSYFDVDDGMSKHLTQTGARTEGYTAPEVYSSLIGPEIDYYSLGVTLWELLTAKEPFVSVDGKPMVTATIFRETTQGKLVDTLLSRAPQLSTRMKTLIKGLMTKRHDKRWGYKEVTKFLNGEEVPVYTELNQIPPILVGEVECCSFKEIASEILKDKSFGKKYVFNGDLPRKLLTIDKKLSNEIWDLVDEFSANGNKDEGLFKIALKLCPNLEFNFSEKTSVSSISEVLNVLETKPNEIIPFLVDETRDFYLYLKVKGFEEPAKKILQIVKSTDDNSLLITKIILSLKGNSISPFCDGVNDNIVLFDLTQVDDLSDALKERLLLKIDAGDRFVYAWFENQSGKNMKEWVNISFHLPLSKEKLGVSRWELFKKFIDKDYTTKIDYGYTKKIIENVQYFSKKQNNKVLNLLIDATWQNFFNMEDYKNCSLILNEISNDTTSLINEKNFYLDKLGICLYNLLNYETALLVFKLVQENRPNDYEACRYSALCAFNLNYYDLVLNNVTKALNQQPEDCELLNLKGKTLYIRKKYEEAIVAFTMAIDIKESKKSYLNRAKCYDELAKDGAPDLKQKAEADRESAKNVDSTDFSDEFKESYGNKPRLSESKNAITVGKSGKCDYNTIQKAIDSASENSVIHVLPGKYEENIRFTKSIKLVGCEEYIANKSSDELPVVIFDENYSCKIDVPVSIEGIVFTQEQNLQFNSVKKYTNEKVEIHDVTPGDYGEDNFNTILWVNSESTFKNIAVMNGENYGVTFSKGSSVMEYSFICRILAECLYCVVDSTPVIKYSNITNSHYSNVYVTDKSEPNMSDCNVFNSWEGIRIEKNAGGRYENCGIYDNERVGFDICGESTPSITNCEVHDNESYGFDICGESTPAITNCEIHDNKQNGFVISENSKPVITDCKIHDNKTEGECYPGVVAMGYSAPILKGCEIYNHLSNGIWIKENAGGNYENCGIYDNESYGFHIIGESTPSITNCEVHDNESNGFDICGESTPAITNCEIHDNKQNGFVISENSKPVITDCKIHDNKTEGKCYPGVVAMGYSAPILKGCEIYNHLSCGIWIKENAGGTYKNCKIHDNKYLAFDKKSSKTVDTSSCECWNNLDE